MKKHKNIIKEIKKILLCSICCLMLTVGIIQAASTTVYVYLTSSNTTATSSPVGLGTAATYYGECYSTSTSSMNMKCLACWDGWPYSTEANETIKPGQTKTVTDTQSKSSSFKVKISGGKTCYGYAKLTLTK